VVGSGISGDDELERGSEIVLILEGGPETGGLLLVIGGEADLMDMEDKDSDMC